MKAMEQDPLIKETLGEKFTKSYLKAKRKEWKGYLAQISEWELNQYLYLI